jgi:hypothetical protein
MTRLRAYTALLATAVLASCSRDGVQIISAPTPPAGAFIKFYNFAVNSPSVNFFANDTKITAISSTSCTPVSVPPVAACSTTGIEAATGTAYGSLGNAGLYSSIDAGQYTFTGRVATATDNGLSVSKLASTVTAPKHYSLFTSGFYDPTAKTTDAFILEDAFPDSIQFVTSAVRFVNAISNSNAMTLWAKNTVTGDSIAIGTNIAYKSGSPFVILPGNVYDLTVRYAGSNTAQILRAGVSFVSSHVYTVTARGDMTVVSTTATNRPFLDNTANR